jgi:cyclic pyranopterin phosphate synthase
LSRRNFGRWSHEQRYLDDAGAIAACRPDPGQLAIDYEWIDGEGSVGFIDPVTRPFCAGCDRLRLTADGQFRNCLFSTVEWDARGTLRSGCGSAEIDARLAHALRECVAAKRQAHGIGTPAFKRPERAMYQIGG